MHRPLVSALALIGLGLGAILLLPLAVEARDDVPEEVRAMENPVKELSEKRVAYFAKQFHAKCARCHGADGTGEGEEAAQQEVPPTDFTDANVMEIRSDGQLFYQILMGGGDRCAMPAFGPDSDHGWSEQKIWEMVAFVRRFSRAPKGE